MIWTIRITCFSPSKSRRWLALGKLCVNNVIWLVSWYWNFNSSLSYVQELGISNHKTHSKTHSEKQTNLVMQKIICSRKLPFNSWMHLLCFDLHVCSMHNLVAQRSFLLLIRSFFLSRMPTQRKNNDLTFLPNVSKYLTHFFRSWASPVCSCYATTSLLSLNPDHHCLGSCRYETKSFGVTSAWWCREKQIKVIDPGK